MLAMRLVETLLGTLEPVFPLRRHVEHVVGDGLARVGALGADQLDVGAAWALAGVAGAANEESPAGAQRE